MLTRREKTELAKLLLREEAVLDFNERGFRRFVLTELGGPLPPVRDMDGAVCGPWWARLVVLIDRPEPLTPYPEAVRLLNALLRYYEAAVAAGGAAGRWLAQGQESRYGFCRRVLRREARQHPCPSRRPVWVVLPSLGPPPCEDLAPARYYAALWRRTCALNDVGDEIDDATLPPSDVLRRAYAAELLVLARAFDALDALRGLLRLKRRLDTRARIAHLLVRASPIHRSLRALLRLEFRVFEGETPAWLVAAVTRFNADLLDALADAVAAFDPETACGRLLDAAAVVAEFFDARMAHIAAEPWRRGWHSPYGYYESSFRIKVGHLLRRLGLFALALNERECTGRTVLRRRDGSGDGSGADAAAASATAILYRRVAAGEELAEHVADMLAARRLPKVRDAERFPAVRNDAMAQVCRRKFLVRLPPL